MSSKLIFIYFSYFIIYLLGNTVVFNYICIHRYSKPPKINWFGCIFNNNFTQHISTCFYKKKSIFVYSSLNIAFQCLCEKMVRRRLFLFYYYYLEFCLSKRHDVDGFRRIKCLLLCFSFRKLFFHSTYTKVRGAHYTAQTF